MDILKESEKLAQRAWVMLVSKGWPQEAITEVSDLLIGAGYWRCLEDQRKAAIYKDTMIERATREN
jgi:hypothetical protein